MSCRIRALAGARSTCRLSPLPRPGPGASQPSPTRSGRRSAKHLPRRGLCRRPARIRSLHHGDQHLAGDAGKDRGGWPLPLWRAGLGPHARRRDQHRQGDGVAGLRRLCVRPRRRQRRRSGRGVRHLPPRRPAGDRQRRQSELHRGARQGAGLDAAAASRDRGAHGGGRRPRGRAQADASHHAVRAVDRGEAAVQRQVARRLRHGELRRGHGRA